MLTNLRIKNLALVDDLALEFPAGYTAITGETGAGKSILIGALNLLLGERADRNLIRSGRDTCTVEAVFDVADLAPAFHAWLADRGLEACENSQLLLRRNFNNSGGNRQFVNNSPTTLQTLSELGNWLVDLHGPHEHQSLLRPHHQLDLLDAFGASEKPRRHFQELIAQRRLLESEKAALVIDETTYARQLALLQHQVDEIESANLRPEEEEELTTNHSRCANAARLVELGQEALRLLADSEHDLLAQSGQLGRILQDLQKLDPTTAGLVSLHADISSLLQDLQQQIHPYVEALDTDPQQLREIEQRLACVQGLKRKYGSTIREILSFGKQARHDLTTLQDRESELGRIRQETEQLDSELTALAAKLSAQRRRAIPKLCRSVTDYLRDLGFRQSRFEIEMTTLPPPSEGQDRFPSPNGLDRVDFQFSPNPGEPTRPLRTVASSGEMARVMLALKTALADQDQVPVLVFDEVDANIGGEVAQTVGQMMRRLGQRRQVFCITHLAPVAAHASAHYVVSKNVRQNRTTTHVQCLKNEERVPELARMLGGQTDPHARRLAVAMLDSAPEIAGKR